MPLPTPKDGESKNDFVSRCVSKLSHMGEFKDNDQRVAVCYSQYKRGTKNEETEMDYEVFVENRELFEDEISEATFKRTNRVRGGKVQRRKKVSAKDGYKVDKDGKVVRMSASERLKRKRGARKASKKRKSKKSQIARKTKKSMRLRKARGL